MGVDEELRRDRLFLGNYDSPIVAESKTRERKRKLDRAKSGTVVNTDDI